MIFLRLSFLCPLALGAGLLAGSLSAQEAAVAASPLQPATREAAAPQRAFSLDSETLKSQLIPLLQERFKLEGDLELSLRTPWKDLPAAVDPYTVRVTDFPNIMSGLCTLRIIASSGPYRSEHIVVLSASLWRQVYVTRTPVEPGDLVDVLELDTRRTDMLSPSSREAILDGTLPQDMVFRNRLQPGRQLTSRDLVHRSLVRKGQQVEVDASEGALSISMKGIALQNGSAGETILVRNPSSNRDIRAEVVGEGRVAVKF